jgi:hypothetical protein
MLRRDVKDAEQKMCEEKEEWIESNGQLEV